MLNYTCGVVIPFYQKERGILRRCLVSILEQSFEGSIVIAIVDDESPLPSQLEIDGLPIPAHIEIHVLYQKNAGPGMARNAGIDFLEARSVSFVSFIDSDDTWTKDHLANALLAFINQADLYTSDWLLTDGKTNGFHLRNIDESSLKFDGKISFGGFLKKSLLEQEVTNSSVKLSSLVIRLEFLSSTRFHRTLRYASEDRLFLIELALKQPKCFFSLNQETIAGSGVNIYESVTYGSLALFNTQKDKLLGRTIMCSLLGSEYQYLTDKIRKELVQIKKEVTLNFLSCIKKREYRALKEFFFIVVKYPSTLKALMAVLLNKLKIA